MKNVTKRLGFIVAVTAFTSSTLVYAGHKSSNHSENLRLDWSNSGQNLRNNHHNPNAKINKRNIDKLAELCQDSRIDHTNGDPNGVPATRGKPAIIGDIVYWAGSTGYVGAHKIKRTADGNATCKKLWVKKVNDVFTSLGDVGTFKTRTTPTYYERKNGKGTLLYRATDIPFSLLPEFWLKVPTYLYALDAKTGETVFVFQNNLPGELDERSVVPATTSSPRIYEGVAYFGMSSFNNVPPFLNILPPTVSGQIYAVDLDIKSKNPQPYLKWTTFTLPPRPDSVEPGKWFSGAGVWGSGPSIIPNKGKDKKGLVIVGSGNLHNYPDFVADCMVEPVEPYDIDGFTVTQKGETGGGAAECHQRATQQLKEQYNIDHPIANNSVIALNIKDGSFAWTAPLAGIDAWTVACGDLDPLGNNCTNPPVPGPDWDVGGSAPIVVGKGKKQMIITHHKGGVLFWIDPKNGDVKKRVDVCVGGTQGGPLWGMAYDPKSETVLMPCSGGYRTSQTFPTTLADGNEICASGYLAGVGFDGHLKFQSVPAGFFTVDDFGPSSAQPDDRCFKKYSFDSRFKVGLDFDNIIKNKVLDVPVNYMPDSDERAPSVFPRVSVGAVPATSKGIAYFAASTGATYAVDVDDGHFLQDMYCDQGAVYSSGPSIANGYVVMGCGGSNPGSEGKNVIVYGVPDKKFQRCVKHETRRCVVDKKSQCRHKYGEAFVKCQHKIEKKCVKKAERVCDKKRR